MIIGLGCESGIRMMISRKAAALSCGHMKQCTKPDSNISGWCYTYPSEKYELVSWEYYSQYMEIHKSHVPNHQPDIEVYHPKLRILYHALF